MPKQPHAPPQIPCPLPSKARASRNFEALASSCSSLHALLPWPEEKPREALSRFLAFALSLAQMPAPPGSLGSRLDLAFPRGSLPSEESEVFLGLARASRALGCMRFELSARGTVRACELAPLLLGGRPWLENSSLARSARLALTRALADACARRASGGFEDRGQAAPDELALASFDQALRRALAAPWPPRGAALDLALGTLARGSTSEWPVGVAARERLALIERDGLDASCSARAYSERSVRL